MCYCIGWLPVNLYNVLLDAKTDLFGDNIEIILVFYVVCHIVSGIFVRFTKYIRNRVTLNIKNHKLTNMGQLPNLSMYQNIVDLPTKIDKILSFFFNNANNIFQTKNYENIKTDFFFQNLLLANIGKPSVSTYIYSFYGLSL